MYQLDPASSCFFDDSPHAIAIAAPSWLFSAFGHVRGNTDSLVNRSNRRMVICCFNIKITSSLYLISKPSLYIYLNELVHSLAPNVAPTY